ncbi:MFS transporter, partial [Micromonospora sp. NPDC000018]
ASSAAWLASAAGAALTPLLLRWPGAAPGAALLRILQGLTVVGMGLFAGPVGVLVAYLACYTVHGASNPLHMGLLHRQVDGPYRTSVLSLNSMMAQPAGALGGVVLMTLAEATSISTAMLVGAVVLAVAAPLYLPAWRAGRRTPDGPGLVSASEAAPDSGPLPAPEAVAASGPLPAPGAGPAAGAGSVEPVSGRSEVDAASAPAQGG